MDDILQTILHKEEKILWEGKAEPFTTLDRTHKNAYLKKLCITLAVTLALLLLYFTTVSEVEPFIVAVMLFLAAYICIKPLTEARQLRSARYLVTDERLVLITDEVVNVVYTDIPMAAIRTDADGHSSLLCGQRAIAAAPQQRRSFAATGAVIDMDSQLCDSLIFYAVADIAGMKEALRPYLTVN